MLKVAKLRSNDPKKYLPLAVDMLKDRLKQNDRTRKRSVRFAHTLETLLIATNDEPELIMKMLKEKSKEKKLSILGEKSKKHLTIASDSLQTITENSDEKIDTSPIESVTKTNIASVPVEILTEDKSRQTLSIIESTIPSSNITDIGEEPLIETLISNSLINQIGLTVAQLVVLAAGQKQQFLKLTNTQIKQ